MLSFRNSKQSYGIIAQLLHWGIAMLLVAQAVLGVYAANLPVSMARLQWMSHHKSLGITLLGLFILRFVWRLVDAPPALPGSMPQWERRAAQVTHWAIYALAFAVILSGWLHASAAGLSANWFGILSLPDLFGKDAARAAEFKLIHKLAIGALVFVLAAHILAALRHAFALRDGVMRRMLPGLGRDK